MQRPNERVTPPEFEPDPQLRLSTGRASGLQIAMVAVACAFILGLMIYGLGRPATTDGSVTAAAPPQQTTGAAPPAEPAPTQGGGNIAGGDNAAPKDQGAPPAEPAKQPEPQMTKPGAVEDDSRR